MRLPKANEAWYLIVFYTLATGGFVLVLFNEVGERTDDSWVSTLANVGFGLGWVVIVAGAIAYTGMEAFNMLAERYARRQREEGREEGRQEVRQEVREKVFDRLAGLERLPPEERLAEIDRLIAEAQRAMNGPER